MISYLARQSWLHDIPAGAKLLALAAASIVVLPVQDWRLLMLALAGCALIYVSLGGEGAARIVRLTRLWPMMALIAFFHLFVGDCQSALANVARLWLMIALADLVTLSTKLTDMMAAITPILSPLKFVGLSVEKIALAVSLVIRFVPLLLENWDRRGEAWRARGGGRLPLRLVAPFLIETLNMADRFAESLAARGFPAGSDRSAPKRGQS